MNKSIFIFVIIVLSAGMASAESRPNEFAGWWIKNYGTVDARQEPLAERASAVFIRVAAAADKKGTTFPRLVIIHSKGDPWAIAIRDGSVLLSSGALKLCYKNVSVEKGDARLAFILGHELSHLAKDDYWHMAAFDALNAYQDDNAARKELIRLLESHGDVKKGEKASNEVAKTKELQADKEGLIYMTMAGYDPKQIVERDKTNFFEEWVSQITGRASYSDETHAGPAERATFVLSQIAPIVDSLNLFKFGVRMYQLERYEDAILFFDAFKNVFPGREVFNNLALCHYQLAMRALAACNPSLPYRFKLTTAIDQDTLASAIRTRGGGKDQCFQSREFRDNLAKATGFFLQAADRDPAYLPARINLAAAYIMAGDYSKAMGAAKDALEINPGSPGALNARGVAVYLFGQATGIDTVDNALSDLKESAKGDSDALYNMAAIQAERGRNAAALESWKAFLQQEPSGPYAAQACSKLNLAPPTATPSKAGAVAKSPVRLGAIRPETKKALAGMKKSSFTIGELSGDIYEGEGLTVLVLDDTVEIVESRNEQDLQLTAKLEGGPAKTVKTAAGKTLVHPRIALDMVAGKPAAAIFYE